MPTGQRSDPNHGKAATPEVTTRKDGLTVGTLSEVRAWTLDGATAGTSEATGNGTTEPPHAARARSNTIIEAVAEPLKGETRRDSPLKAAGNTPLSG